MSVTQKQFKYLLLLFTFVFLSYSVFSPKHCLRDYTLLNLHNFTQNNQKPKQTIEVVQQSPTKISHNLTHNNQIPNYNKRPKQAIERVQQSPTNISHNLTHNNHKPKETIEVVQNSPTNISHILFGIASSARTWPRRRPYTEVWWRPGLTRGHVWLDRAPYPRRSWPRTCPPYKISTVNTSKFGKLASASRIANIVVESYNLGFQNIRWFVMGDDDTVFFTENLVRVLGKYDHRDMYYVGSNSESVEQDVIHLYGMGFGGGGFAVSLSAARELAKAMGGCLERYGYLFGSDQRVHACLSEIGVPLTREPGFHQVDIRGDMYGILAAHPIAPLLSLHHLDYIKPINPRTTTQLDAVRSLVDASRFDQARILQQSFCYLRDPSFNWSVSVSWGYTIQLYPRILFPKDLEVPLQTFKTWRSVRMGPFTFNTREFRLDRPCERPILFFLDKIKYRKGNFGIIRTVTRYSKYEPEGSKRCDLPSFLAALKVENVTVIAAKMDFNQRRKAPRRQCCETLLRKLGKSIEVRIRDCYPGEISSPP